MGPARRSPECAATENASEHQLLSRHISATPSTTGAAAVRGARGTTDGLLAVDGSSSSDPTVAAEGMTFARLGLPQRLVTALERRDIRAPFAIQTLALPDALAGRDVLGRAQTGSGKTLAFGLPMLARLAEGSRSTRAATPRGLVLVPTRELASQVRDALEPLGHAVGLKVVAVFGGASMSRQIQALRQVDIVVATPGRLLDLLERHEVSLGSVEVSALDEADHMADLGFLPAVSKLLDATPADAQRLLFSATLDGAVDKLVRRYLSNQVTHSVAPVETQVATMDHRAFSVDANDKVNVLAEIAARPARTLMFVRTKHGADRLAKQLRRMGVEAGAIHGNLTQNARQRALEAFSSGRARVLVATDVAARGIHVDDVDLVVHVDPPNDHKDYLHRSGRTARAGASGTVLSLLLPEQLRDADKLRQRAGVRTRVVRVAPGSPEVREIATSGTPLPPAPPEPQQASSSSERGGGARRSRPRRTGSGERSGSGQGFARPQRSGRSRAA
jgi:superfamily II DNA/RNA helicase